MRHRVLPVIAFALAVACARGVPLDPVHPRFAKVAPDSFDVHVLTTKGPMLVRVRRAWSPHGADRFHALVRSGFFTDVAFHRTIRNFVAQFGIHGDPAVSAVWRERRIPDDSVKQSNQLGFLTFASSGANSRTTQLFINRRDNRRLDAMGFAPIGRIIDGQAAADSLYEGYGEGPPRGAGPEQSLITSVGNVYLERAFPRLDSIVRARIVKD